MRRAVGILRLVAAATGLVALISYFVYVQGFSTFSTANYFAYFTQQSNMANVVVMAVSGVFFLRGRRDPPWFAVLHALVTTYVIVSGIIYGIIVAQSAGHNYTIGVPWSSQVLHFYLSTFVLIDWVLAPGRTRIRWRVLPLVVPFPVVWGIATIVRGADVGWYPYFFLDPAQVMWPGEFAFYNGIAVGTIIGVMAALIGLSHLRPRRDVFTGAVPPRVLGGAAEGERARG
ncbi:Pr6Pr family membrane protein [Frigoribacterium sp. 2-23]|uniref:Pr6Pr family membrane protein n=1 Tax=Frigoribacterium sp. 2-23 TaxID=3415006 RepID=UPI003C6EEECC